MYKIHSYSNLEKLYLANYIVASFRNKNQQKQIKCTTTDLIPNPKEHLRVLINSRNLLKKLSHFILYKLSDNKPYDAHRILLDMIHNLPILEDRKKEVSSYPNVGIVNAHYGAENTFETMPPILQSLLKESFKVNELSLSFKYLETEEGSNDLFQEITNLDLIKQFEWLYGNYQGNKADFYNVMGMYDYYKYYVCDIIEPSYINEDLSMFDDDDMMQITDEYEDEHTKTTTKYDSNSCKFWTEQVHSKLDFIFNRCITNIINELATVTTPSSVNPDANYIDFFKNAKIIDSDIHNKLYEKSCSLLTELYQINDEIEYNQLNVDMIEATSNKDLIRYVTRVKDGKDYTVHCPYGTEIRFYIIRFKDGKEYDSDMLYSKDTTLASLIRLKIDSPNNLNVLQPEKLDTFKERINLLTSKASEIIKEINEIDASLVKLDRELNKEPYYCKSKKDNPMGRPIDICLPDAVEQQTNGNTLELLPDDYSPDR